MKLTALILAMLIAAPGNFPVAPVRAVPKAVVAVASPIVFPIDQFRERDTLKEFGTWVDDGRFLGYHLGDDYKFPESDLRDWMIAKPDGTEEGNVVGKFLDSYEPPRNCRSNTVGE